MIRAGRLLALCTALSLMSAAPALSQVDYVEFESGPVRPIAMTPDGNTLLAVNTSDNHLEVFSINAGSLTHTVSVPVGMEPVAVAARTNTEVWVVNHLSDSVSIVDLSATPPQVVRTLLVGDEPRDIVFAGTTGNRAFITTAHRGQHRTDSSLNSVAGLGNDDNGGIEDGDPELTTSGVDRADVWIFDGTSSVTLGSTIGGTPIAIRTFFSDTPRALAVGDGGDTVYVAAFHSGNETTVINETQIPDGFGGSGVPGPDTNFCEDDGQGGCEPGTNVAAPETGVIVKKDGGGVWRDAAGNNRNSLVNFDLPDHDVFTLDANTLVKGQIFDHVGTILFNMVTNPVNGKIYVTNTEEPNHVRFEGPGNFGGSTVQGHLSESRITVIDPSGPSQISQHLNHHINYANLHTDNPDIVDVTAKNHSLATPLQSVVTSDGSTVYTAAFGSAKIGVFPTSDLESATFDPDFDPTVESANYLSTGGGPGGLALDEANNVLYVWTRFDNSVSVIDLGTGNTAETHALHNPAPQSVTEGRPFLYDAFNFSGNGETSCSSCHIFADFDSLAWNLGDPDATTSTNSQPSSSVLPPAATFHPMKGPMTTQTLRGLANHGGMHWRGDRVDGFFGLDPCTEPTGAPCDEEHSFNNFIVAFEGLVGMDGMPTAIEMQKFTDFALQIMLPPNPIRALDNSLCENGGPAIDDCPPGQASQQDGLNQFTGPVTDTVEECNGCHDLVPLEGFFGSMGEQSFEGEPQNAKVPHMRNLYQKVGMFFSGNDEVRGFGFLHDGSVDTVETFVSAPVFTFPGNASQQQQAREDVEAFALAFDTDLAPIVGQQVTLDSTNNADTLARIALMIQRSDADFDSLMLGGALTGECDIVVKGSVGGVERGWVLHAGDTMFDDDLGGSISDAALQGLATSEGPLTYTAVPPGTGTRMGIDRDLDTLLDGTELGLGTDPANADTDGDGFDDNIEVAQGTDPLDPLSFPGAIVPSLPPAALLALSGLVAALGGGALFATRRRIA